MANARCQCQGECEQPEKRWGCRAFEREYNRQYLANRLASDALYERRRKRKQTFGLTEEQFQSLWDAQGGRCAICTKKLSSHFPHEPGARMAVDHDHKTGLVRGLLCSAFCNRKLLGYFSDSIVLFEAAASYLRNPPARAVIGDVVAPVHHKPKKRRRRRTRRTPK